jgi:hypothetical protein
MRDARSRCLSSSRHVAHTLRQLATRRTERTWTQADDHGTPDLHSTPPGHPAQGNHRGRRDIPCRRVLRLASGCQGTHTASFIGGGGGSGVTGVVAREVTLRSGGSPLNYDLGDTTVYAPFEDGWAFADSEVGIPSALGVIGEYLENQSGGDTTTDSLGNFHRAAAVAKLAFIAAFGNPNPLTVEAAALAVGLYLSLGEQLVDCIAEHS